MPKELFEVKAFESGIYYNPDDRDMPDDAAVYSENIDPYGQEGSLRAIHADATPIIAGVKATRMATINDNGTHRMVFVDDSDGDIMKVDDVHGSPALASLEDGSFITSGEIPALQVNNKEVHMGLGKTRDPKWVGIIPHGHFGAAAPAGLQIEDAELASPSPFPNMHTIVNDATNTYCYGIKLDGNYVYKFDVSAGKLIKRSDYYFTETRAMCLASDGHLWVLDEVSSNIKILKIDPVDMDAMISTDVNSFTNDTSVTDCIDIDDHLWLSCNVEVDNSTTGFLYNTIKSGIVSGATVTFADKTPYLGANGGSISQGSWVSADTGGSILPTFNIPKLPLSEPASSTDYCGIMMHVTDDGTDTNSVKFCKLNTGTPSYATTSTWYYQMVHKDNTADDSGHKADGGEGGKVQPLIGTTSVPAEVYCAKGDDNSNKFFFIAKGSGSTSTISAITKPQFSTTNGTSLTKSAFAASRSLENMVASMTGDNYNLFSGGGSVRWATSDGSTVVAKREGEIDLTFTTNSSVAGTINGGHSHFYATSFVYDGYQESPLSPWELETGVSANPTSINVKVDLYTATLSKRISHINLYRSSPNSTSTQPTGFFRLVKTISLKYGWLTTDTSTTNPDWGNYYTKTIIDTGTSYASYEARTGISEALLNTLPKYGLSAKVNNFLYISDCSHIDIDNATNYLFKSRPFNFDQFNWARDFLLLPSKIVALESFNGRVYAFTENEIYVINPDGMYIEDTLDGVGCIHQNLVKSTDIGMCFMDKNSVYLHDGKQIRDIGARIKSHYQDTNGRQEYTSLESIGKFPSAGGASANTLGYTGERVMSYDPHRKAFYIHFTTKIGISGTYYYLNFTNVYTVPKDRWDIWMRTHASGTTSELTVYGSTNGKNGEVFTSDNESGLIQPFDPHSSTRVDTFTWYSKKFTMGDSTVDKKWFEVAALSEDGTPAIAVNIAENNEIFGSLTSGSKSRDIQVQLSESSDAVSSFNAFRIVYRKLRRVKAMS